jgi:hypothetical protein
VTEANPSEIGALVRQLLGDSLGFLYPAALRVAVRLGIADLLVDGPKTPQDLAELAKVDASYLGRLLRYLATRKVFAEDSATGEFALTPAANLLRAEAPASVRSTVLLLTDDIYWLPAGKLEDTVRDGATSFDKIFGAPMFEYFDQNEDTGNVFHTGIADLSTMEQYGIAESYDFPATGTVVDVAGGPGGFLSTVLAANPGLHGVLAEQEALLRQHRLTDPAIAGRWETVTADFFSSVPDTGDIYVLKRVLHDWDDASCVRILRTCRAAMSAEARLLVVDAIVPKGNDPHPSKLYDIAMMTNFNGKERTEEEFDELFAAADLKANRVITTPGTLSIIEAVAR